MLRPLLRSKASVNCACTSWRSVSTVAQNLEPIRAILKQRDAGKSDHYRKLQSALVANPTIISSLASDGATLEQCISTLSKNWAKSIDARIWTLDALSKMASSKDPQFTTVLLEVIRSAWTTREVALYCTILNQLCGSYSVNEKKRLSQRWNLLVFIRDFKWTDRYWGVMADFLVRAALLDGKPLLACSIAIRLKTTVSLHSVRLISRCLAYEGGSTVLYNISALQSLVEEFPKFDMADSTKSMVVSNAITLVENSETGVSLVNDCYRMINMNGGRNTAASLHISHKVILWNLQHNNPQHALEIWNKIDPHKNNDPGSSAAFFQRHTGQFLARLIFGFSKHKNYRAVVTKGIVDRIPEERYGDEGITEALLMHSGRTRNYTLAKKVYSHIATPIRRTTLTYLLHLHCLFKDTTGSEKIMAEINSRNDILQPSELSTVLKSLVKIDFQKGVDLIERFPLPIAFAAVAELANAAIDLGHYKTAQHYLDLLISSSSPSLAAASKKKQGLVTGYQDHHNDNDVVAGKRALTNKQAGFVASIQIKYYTNQNDLSGAKKAWQELMMDGYWADFPGYAMVGLRSILDVALRQNDLGYRNWLWNEFGHLGLGPAHLKRLVQNRAHYRNLSEEQKWAWTRM